MIAFDCFRVPSSPGWDPATPSTEPFPPEPLPHSSDHAVLNTFIQVGEPLKPAALEKLRKQSKAALLSRHHQMPPALAQRPPPADSQPASGAASALGAGAKRTSMFGRLTQRASTSAVSGQIVFH